MQQEEWNWIQLFLACILKECSSIIALQQGRLIRVRVAGSDSYTNRFVGVVLIQKFGGVPMSQTQENDIHSGIDFTGERQIGNTQKVLMGGRNR